MKVSTILVTALTSVGAALAVDVQKSVIISYPDPTTPNSVIDQAKDAVRQSGGIVTHEYQLIK